MVTWNNLIWFALTVRPNHERTAARSLRNQGFEAYVPMYRARRRWSDRVRESDAILFPGYVFCRFGHLDRLAIVQSPGVRFIVGNGRQPVPVADDEIAAIRKVIASGRAILPWPYLRIGQDVAISDGPLAPLRGVILRAKNAWRVVVSVEALGSSVAVEVDNDMVSPVTSSIPKHGTLAASVH